MSEEKKFNTHSVVAIVTALISGTVCAVMHADLYAAIAFSFAFGVAALPQPIAKDN
jgi:hypothetical protein